MPNKITIAAILAASISTAAFAQQPPALPADDPQLTKVHEELQKKIAEMRAQLEQMQKEMGVQGLDVHQLEVRLPELILDPAGNNPGVAVQIGEVRKEKAAYLGTSTSPASATTREQLKLPKGIGLALDFVDPDSPAAAAGLQPHDVLTKLDDQWLVNMQQLAVLVRMHKPGDSVKLTYIRAGESKTADVKLVEKEVPVLDDNMMFGQPFQIPLPAPNLRGDILLPRPDAAGGPAWQPAGRVTVKTEDGVTTRTLTDADQTLTLTIDKDGKKTLGVVNLKDHEIAYSGPVDTEDDRKKLPAGVADKLKRLESDRVGAIRVNLGGGIQGNGRVIINGDANGNGMSKMIVSRSDNDGTLRIETTNGDKHLTAKDKQGNTLYDGPINTDEERKKVPADVLNKLDAMEGKAGR